MRRLPHRPALPRGGINDEFPFLLGHEAAGVVEAVGGGVTDVTPGDFVVLNWRAVCGRCRACSKGKPWYCFATQNATQPMTLLDGTPLSPALGIGAFAEKTLVAAGQCTKIDPAAAPAAAGLLECGVMAGFGAAVNTGAVGRGDSIAVIGCGGVGMAAIAGAEVAGASKIIAVDVDERKLEWAAKFGATDTVNSSQNDAVEAIRALTGGFGADVVIDAVGRPETYKQAFHARDLSGTAVLVGVPAPELTVELPLLDVFGRGGALKSSWYGDCLPSRDFPALIDLYLQGRFDCAASSARGSPWPRWRKHSRGCIAARSCARWWSCDRASRALRHLRNLPAGRQQWGGGQQGLVGRQQQGGSGHRRDGDRHRRGRAARDHRCMHSRIKRPHQRRPGAGRPYRSAHPAPPLRRTAVEGRTPRAGARPRSGR